MGQQNLESAGAERRGLDVIGSLVARIDIAELTARYNRAADGDDPGALLATFTGDGIVEMRGHRDGPAVYAGKRIAELLAPYNGQRVHMTTDAVVEIDGDRATQECTLLLCTRSRGRGVAAMLTGRYSDELVRTPDGWRFTRRVVEVDYANEAQMPLASAKDAPQQ